MVKTWFSNKKPLFEIRDIDKRMRKLYKRKVAVFKDGREVKKFKTRKAAEKYVQKQGGELKK